MLTNSSASLRTGCPLPCRELCTVRAAVRACLCGTVLSRGRARAPCVAAARAGKIFNFSWVTSAQVGRIGKKRDIIVSLISNARALGPAAPAAGASPTRGLAGGLERWYAPAPALVGASKPRELLKQA